MKRIQILIGLLVSCISLFGQLNVENDSLKKILDSTVENSVRIRILNDLAWNYSLIDIDTAKFYSDKAIQFSEISGNKDDLATSLEMKGIIDEMRGRIQEAIESHLAAILLHEESQNLEGIASGNNNIGVLFYVQENYEEALKYFIEGLRYEELSKDSVGIAESLINIALILTTKDRNDSAIQLLRKAYGIIVNSDENYVLSQVIVNLAANYHGIHNIDSSEYYYQRAIEIGEKEGDIEALANVYGKLGTLYLDISRFSKAEEALNKAIEYADRLGQYYYLANILKSMVRVQLAKKDYISAWEYQKQFEIYNDSLRSFEHSQMVNELSVRYETEKKEKEIAKLQLDKVEADLDLTAKENQRNLFFFSSLIILILAGFAFYRYRKKREVNILLLEKNKQISEALTERELLLKEIHHRVKNNLQIISSLLNLQASHLEDQGAIEAVKEGQNRVKSMALIHQKLYQNDNMNSVNMGEYIDNLVGVLFSSYNMNEDIELKLEVQEVKLDIDTLIPLGLILNELVSNSLKHAFQNKKGQLKIVLEEKSNMLELSVRDNGQDLSHEVIAESTSFGWKMIQSLAKKLDASIEISSDDAGTQILLKITNYKLVA